MAKHNYFPLPCPNQQGTLLLTPCPGTLEASLEDSLDELRAGGATAVITLMTEPEMAKNNVEHMAAVCAQQGLDWFHLPVEDEGAPTRDFADAWAQVKAQVHQHLDNQGAVAVHCKGGSGRTGVVAAQILMERGLDKDEAVANVKALRPNAFAHAVQVDYINQLATQL